MSGRKTSSGSPVCMIRLCHLAESLQCHALRTAAVSPATQSGSWTFRESNAIVRVMVYRIRVALAVEKWLDELRRRDPASGELTDEAIARLRDGGPEVGSPLVVKVAQPLGYPGQPAAEPPGRQDDPRETLDDSLRQQ